MNSVSLIIFWGDTTKISSSRRSLFTSYLSCETLIYSLLIQSMFFPLLARMSDSQFNNSTSDSCLFGDAQKNKIQRDSPVCLFLHFFQWLSKAHFFSLIPMTCNMLWGLQINAPLTSYYQFSHYDLVYLLFSFKN